jgi:hypothetical protein
MVFKVELESILASFNAKFDSIQNETNSKFVEAKKHTCIRESQNQKALHHLGTLF